MIPKVTVAVGTVLHESCPDNTTSVPYQAFCSCSPGTAWDFTLESCQACPADHYNLYSNMTSSVPCPSNSNSNPGAVSCSCHAGYKLINNSTCEMCPENTISSSGSLTCSPCPHFKVAAPGSEFCYKCTFGEYWENHQCLPCPDHLYGDGVHCLACPDGFSVLAGFCYKTAGIDPQPSTAPSEPLYLLTTIIAIGNTLVILSLVLDKVRCKDVKDAIVTGWNRRAENLQSTLDVLFSRPVVGSGGDNEEGAEEVDLVIPSALKLSDLEIGESSPEHLYS